MPSKLRILVMSHAHPDFSLGGGEIAAYNLFQAARGHPGVEDAWFLARVDRNRPATGAISLRRPQEYLWEQSVSDWLLIKAANRESVLARFRELVAALRPDVVHAHHYAHLGVEYLSVLRQVLPAAKIVLTLHEFMAICRNNGQMVKTGGRGLCSSESPEECNACFPEHSPEDFWLRKHFIQGHFSHVDTFVAPSEFLRRRYVAWGLPADKVVVIENGQSALPPLPPRPLAAGEARARFAYFGQVNPYKGLLTLLEALHQVPVEAARGLLVEVHANHLDKQAGELQERVTALAEPLAQRGLLHWAGAYRREEQRARMAAIDWVLVPSIWWENSPMVIQEAFGCGRPVITSDIGGMAEKVRHGEDGLHVRAGHPQRWAEALVQAATTPGLWERLAAGIRRPPTVADCLQAHLPAYGLAVRAARR